MWSNWVMILKSNEAGRQWGMRMPCCGCVESCEGDMVSFASSQVLCGGSIYGRSSSARAFLRDNREASNWSPGNGPDTHNKGRQKQIQDLSRLIEYMGTRWCWKWSAIACVMTTWSIVIVGFSTAWYRLTETSGFVLLREGGMWDVDVYVSWRIGSKVALNTPHLLRCEECWKVGWCIEDRFWIWAHRNRSGVGQEKEERETKKGKEGKRGFN